MNFIVMNFLSLYVEKLLAYHMYMGTWFSNRTPVRVRIQCMSVHLSKCVQTLSLLYK